MVLGSFAGFARRFWFSGFCFCGRVFGEFFGFGEEGSLDEVGNSGGEITGIGNGNGALGFGAALLASAAGVGGVGL